MLQNFYTTFILWIILVVLIVLLLRYVSERLDKKFEEKEKLTDIYLDSVFNRINTASTAEALLLLNTEMVQSLSKYVYYYSLSFLNTRLRTPYLCSHP